MVAIGQISPYAGSASNMMLLCPIIHVVVDELEAAYHD
jgi:hypothetical protein